MTLGQRVRSYRREKGWNQEQLAAAVRAIGRPMNQSTSQSTISDIERGISEDPHCVPELAEIFGVTEKQLRNGDDAPPIPTKSNVKEHQTGGETGGAGAADREAGGKLVTTVVTFAGRLDETGRTGGWVIYAEHGAASVMLAPVLGEVPRIFKVEVLDEDNVPVYEPRDVLSCYPDKQPLANNYCVFVGDRGVDGGIPAVLGKLVRFSATEWIVKPYAAEEMKLPRSTWLYAWVVFRRDQPI